MSKFKDFFRVLAKPEDKEYYDDKKNLMHNKIKQKWIDRVMVDNSQDELIFHYTEIFPLDEQSGLAH